MIIFVFIRSMRTLILYTLILAYFEGRSQLDGTKWSINELYSSENLSFLPNVYFFKENVNLGRNINFNNGKFDIYENIPCLNVCFTSYYGNYFQIDSNKVVFQLDSINYSHSIVAGGFELISYTTLLTPFTLFIISFETSAKNS
jgi:hypothetical protein